MLSSRLISSLMLGVLALATSGSAAANIPANVQYRPALGYSAEVALDGAHWRLYDFDGRSLGVQGGAACAATRLPAGVWIVTRDAAGALELLAPSAVPLPAGHSGHIALRDCAIPAEAGDDREALQVPDTVLHWLAENGGAVRVGR